MRSSCPSGIKPPPLGKPSRARARPQFHYTRFCAGKIALKRNFIRGAWHTMLAQRYPKSHAGPHPAGRSSRRHRPLPPKAAHLRIPPATANLSFPRCNWRNASYREAMRGSWVFISRRYTFTAERHAVRGRTRDAARGGGAPAVFNIQKTNPQRIKALWICFLSESSQRPLLIQYPGR